MKTSKNFSGMKSVVRGLEGAFELVTLAVTYYLVWYNSYYMGVFSEYTGITKLALVGVYLLIAVAMLVNLDGFKFGYLRKSEVILSQCIAMFATNVITYLQLCLIANALLNYWPIVLLMVADIVIALLCAVLFDKIYHSIYVPKNMVMVFGTDNSVSLKIKMDTRPDKYQINKLISVEEGYETICKTIVNYDAVVINDVPSQIRNDLLKFCYENKIRTYITPKITDIIICGAEHINLFDTPLLLVKGAGLSFMQRFMKRAMDIVICSLAMIVAAPIMAAVAVAIKLEDGGPVFFRQDRATLDGNVFSILKFRSMIVDAEKGGMVIPATGRDPRITKVGAFIRATRIDELPQILNILKGDMSVVGPRPERVEHMDKYGKEVPEFAFRTKVKGGLTGYAQIYGKYNTSPYDKLRLDLMYIENYSLMLDIKLILMTLRIMLTKESTEGFEQIAENEKKQAQILEQLQNEKADKGDAVEV